MPAACQAGCGCEQRKVVSHGLAEPDARVDEYRRHTGSNGAACSSVEEGGYLGDDVVVARLQLHGGWFSLHVHDDRERARFGA